MTDNSQNQSDGPKETGNDNDQQDLSKLIEEQSVEFSESEPTPFVELPNLQIANLLQVIDNGPKFAPNSRSRGILSTTDREYLFGLKEYAHDQSEANRRQDIRERVKNSLIDFKILWAFLDDADRDQIFGNLGDETVDECIEAMVTFVYLGVGEDLPRLEKAIERGILAGSRVSREDQSTEKAQSVEASIDVDYHPDPEEVHKKLEKTPISQLTVEELGVLVKSGKLNTDDIKRLNDSEIHAPPGYFGNETVEPTVDKDPIHYDSENDNHEG